MTVRSDIKEKVCNKRADVLSDLKLKDEVFILWEKKVLPGRIIRLQPYVNHKEEHEVLATIKIDNGVVYRRSTEIFRSEQELLAHFKAEI